MARLPLGTVRRVGAVLGRLNWLASSRMATTTRININNCLPEIDANNRKLLAKSSISHTFQAMAEGAPAWLWPPEKVLDHILEVDGLEHLEAAKAQGKGVVVMAPHLGNWEVFGLYLNNCGFGRSSQLYQAPKDPRLDKFIYQARSRSGANMVPTNAKGVGLLLKALKRGEIVGILPDQVPNDQGGEFAPLFGRQAFTMTLVARLLEKTGAKAVLGYARRVRVGNRAGWKIVFMQPGNDIYARHIPNSLLAMNRCIELAVHESPEQYQWEYKRFRRVPEGETRPY